MSARRSRTRTTRRREEKQLRQEGVRPWSDAPALKERLLTPLAAGFAGLARVATCAHLDGLQRLEDLDQPAFWCPVQVQSLTCAECLDSVVSERNALIAANVDVGLPSCDGCGTPSAGMVTFTNAAEGAPLTVIGAFCANCLARAGVV